MAGLCAAARARELGAEPLVLEKGDRPGGSMLLSSCVIWRHREFADFRSECPAGDERLQRMVFEGLDEGLEWLESLGAQPIERGTGNPRTIGIRFDPRQLTESLVPRSGEIRLNSSFSQPDARGAVLLATGGFPRKLAAEQGLLLRANSWSEGDGLDYAQARGAATSGDLEEFYGRALPVVAEIGEQDFVRLAQLYGRFADVTSEDGSQRFEGEASWSETDLVQAIARWPRGRAWYTVESAALEERVRDSTVGDMIEAARAVGAPVQEEEGRVSVLVQAGVTQTLGGLRIDEQARVLNEEGAPIEGLYAAGADVGGVANGGWASGLAAALVFGRLAAEEALS